MRVFIIYLVFVAWLQTLTALPTSILQGSFDIAASNQTSASLRTTSRNHDTVRGNLTRVRRPPPPKPPPVALGSSDGYDNIDIMSLVQKNRPPPPKPRPTGSVNNNAPNTPETSSGCGLDKPTAQGLEDMREDFNLFVKVNFDAYQVLPSEVYDSFYTYMRDHYASKTAPSSMICDGVGTCSIASCLNLNDELDDRLKQLAYYFFEQLSGIDYLHASTAKASKEAGDYMYNRAHELVEKFSTADEIKESLEIRQNRAKAIQACITAFGLLASGGLGVVGVYSPKTPRPFSIGTAGFNLALNGYLGISGQVTVNREGIPDFAGDLQNWFETHMNSFMHERQTAIDDDLRDLMMGRANHLGEDIVDVLTTGNFLEPDPMFQKRLREVEERYLYAVHVNALWGFGEYRRTSYMWAAY
jgi:hypothetical protein